MLELRQNFTKVTIPLNYLKVTYLPSTNFRGSRVRIKGDVNGEPFNVISSYNYEIGNVVKQAVKEMNDRGHNVDYYSMDEKGNFILLIK
jgi:hypothetical protein